MKKLLAVVFVVMLIMSIGAVPAIASSSEPHNTAGVKGEIRNIESLIEKFTPIKFPKWFAIDLEGGKNIATDVFYKAGDGVEYIEADRGYFAWLTFSFDLNTNK